MGALTIGLDTTHTWDLGSNVADDATSWTMDVTPIVNDAAGVVNAFGWKAANGDPGDLDYRPGSKFTFTDGDQTVYELVTIAGDDNETWTIRQALPPHTGGLEAGARKNQEISTIVCTADSGSDLLDTYFNIQNEDGDKFHVWMNVGGAGTAPTVSGSTAVVAAFVADAANTVVAEAVKDAVHGIDGITAARGSATVTATVTDTGDVVDIADSATATETGFTFAVTEQGSTVNMLLGPISQGAVGGPELVSSDQQRKRHLGYI